MRRFVHTSASGNCRTSRLPSLLPMRGTGFPLRLAKKRATICRPESRNRAPAESIYICPCLSEVPGDRGSVRGRSSRASTESSLAYWKLVGQYALHLGVLYIEMVGQTAVEEFHQVQGPIELAVFNVDGDGLKALDQLGMELPVCHQLPMHTVAHRPLLRLEVQ